MSFHFSYRLRISRGADASCLSTRRCSSIRHMPYCAYAIYDMSRPNWFCGITSAMRRARKREALTGLALDRTVMRRFASCSRSRGLTSAEGEAYRLGGKAQLLPLRPGTVARRRLSRPRHGTHRKSSPESSRQSTGPLLTTRQSSRTLHFLS